MEKKYIGLICIIAVVVIIAAIALGSGGTTESNTTGYQVKITTDGSWSGSIGTTDGTNSYDGDGSEVIDVTNDTSSIVSAVIQKSGGGSDSLKVDILKDGQVVNSKSTDAAYGVVTVTSS